MVSKQGYWKLESNRQLSAEQAAAELGGGPFQVLRIDSGSGKTTIYFAGDEKDVSAATFAAKPKSVTLKDVTK
jgi:hypothetical protein